VDVDVGGERQPEAVTDAPQGVFEVGAGEEEVGIRGTEDVERGARDQETREAEVAGDPGLAGVPVLQDSGDVVRCSVRPVRGVERPAGRSAWPRAICIAARSWLGM
jgi:hypothetical protein